MYLYVPIIKYYQKIKYIYYIIDFQIIYYLTVYYKYVRKLKQYSNKLL